jgi:outer membrane protein insertion porin family
LSAFYRTTNAAELNSGDYHSDEQGARIGYGFPITEYNTAKLGLELKKTNIKIQTSSKVLVYSGWLCDFLNEGPNCTDASATFNTLSVDSSWSHDTRNRTFFASDGALHQLAADVALPGFDLSYYKLRYNYEESWPMFAGFTFQGRASVGYGNGYGKTHDLPFFENFYAGGVSSVRGFGGNSLGTPATKADKFNADGSLAKKDGVALGGSLRTIASAELIFPLPFAENSKSFRVSAFSDIGNVFAGVDDFDAKELRSSYGLSALWVTPVGVLTFNWGWPFTHKAGDERQVFQFFIGAPF